MLGFPDLDTCRDAFYCSIKNAAAVMESEPAVMQDDPVASCEAKLVPRIIPFLPEQVGSATPWLTVVPYNPPCIQIPVDYPKWAGKEAWRVYMGCNLHAEEIAVCNPKEPDCPQTKTLEILKYDQRGSGLFNLRQSDRVGVAFACVMAVILCGSSLALMLFAAVKAVLRNRRNKAPTISKTGDI